MSEAVSLTGLDYLAHVTSVIGKGGAYVLLCALLSAYCLLKRARSGEPLLRASLSPLEQLAWLMWAYWVFGTLLNQALKFTIAQPRPWWIDPASPPLSPEPSMGFGMPSGHAQGAVGMWLFAYHIRRLSAERSICVTRLQLTLCLASCGLWVPLTMWARVALNAHSVAQVCAGLTVGLLWSLALTRLTRARRGVSLLSALFALCLITLSYHLTQPAAVPEQWLEVIRQEVSAPLWFKPKPKVLVALLTAGLGLSWAWWRHMRSEAAHQATPEISPPQP